MFSYVRCGPYLRWYDDLIEWYVTILGLPLNLTVFLMQLYNLLSGGLLVWVTGNGFTVFNNYYPKLRLASIYVNFKLLTK